MTTPVAHIDLNAIRSLTPAEAPAVAALLTASLPHHPVSEERCRGHIFASSRFDPELALGVDDAEGRLAALTVALPLSADGGRQRALLAAFATREDCRRRGLMRALYADLEGRLRRRGVEDVLIDGGVIPSGLDLRYQAAVLALLRRVYVPVAVGYDLTLPAGTQPPAAPPLPPDFELRHLEEKDEAALRDLCAAEFPYWKGIASSGTRRGPSRGFVGVCQRSSGRLAAFAGFDEYIFGPTGTARAFRRLGLGSAVFWEAVRRIRALAPATPLLIGFANIAFYARAFACPMRGVIWRMKKDLTAEKAVCKGK